ncbi:hypothetical protein ACTVBU_10950 [Sanguibacter sp. A246]|uniref:hypothetical protein n=1 Tax=Sanguibacter sp. A246 TaxID=3457326 RepID=UPI003FD889A8
MSKRRPTIADQVQHHISEGRGVWEIPLTAFAKSASRSTAATEPPSKKDSVAEVLPVPGKVGDVADARRLVDRSYAELVAARHASGPPHTLATLQTAVVASVIAAIISRQMSAEPISGIIGWIVFAIMSTLVGLVVGGVLVIAVVSAYKFTRSDDVAIAVWTERHRRYSEQLARLLDDEAQPARQRGASARPRRWLPWR